MDCSPRGSSVHGILQARIMEWVAITLLWGIFLTLGLNPSLLHCRQILYCLSHHGSPTERTRSIYFVSLLKLCIKLSWLLYYYQNSIIKDNLNYAFCYSQPKLLKYTSIKMLSHNWLILDLPELWGYLFANLISSPCSNTFGKYPAVFFTLLEIHKAQDMLNISRSKKLKKNLIMITPTVFIIINQTFPFPCNIYWKSILKKVFT